VINTLFGPLAIGGSVGDTGHREWFFRLGRILRMLTEAPAVRPDCGKITSDINF
jgi:hypothetical protein